MKIRLLSLLILGLLINPFVVFSQENSQLNLKDQKFNPGFIYYPIKRGFEKIWENLQLTDNSKKDFYKELTLTRLSELTHVVQNKEIGEIQTSAERFSYTAGKLTNVLLKINNQEEKKKTASDFEKYVNYIAELQKNYEFNSSYWMLLEHSINSLKDYSSKLQK